MRCTDWCTPSTMRAVPSVALVASRAAARRSVRREIPPLPQRQVTQHHLADTHPLEADDLEPDQLAHAPDLALLAFGQHHPQLLRVLPADLGRLEWLAVERQAVAQQCQAIRRKHRLHVLGHRIVVTDFLHGAGTDGFGGRMPHGQSGVADPHQVLLVHHAVATRPSCVNTSRPIESISSRPAGTRLCNCLG